MEPVYIALLLKPFIAFAVAVPVLIIARCGRLLVERMPDSKLKRTLLT